MLLYPAHSGTHDSSELVFANFFSTKKQDREKRSCECASRENNSLKSNLGKMTLLSLKRSANAQHIRRERQEPNIIQHAKPRFPWYDSRLLKVSTG